MQMVSVAAKSAVRARHAVLSLTTTFRLPHEGMVEMEYLSRGSAFLLDTSGHTRSSTPPRVRDLAVLTCQHVACPWRFPKYFADKWDWLQHVSEEFIEHSLELLEVPSPTSSANDALHAPQPLLVAPKVLLHIPLERHVWLHPTRDVALLSLSETLAELEWGRYAGRDWGLELLSLLPPSDNTSALAPALAAGDVLLFTGHEQLGSAPDAGQQPRNVVGQFVGQSPHGQAFAWSEDVLEDGMCGGAVVRTDGVCVGLIEGIVPPLVDAPATAQSSDVTPVAGSVDADNDSAATMRQALAGHVAFVPATELARFLDDRGPLLATGTLLGARDDNDSDDEELW